MNSIFRRSMESIPADNFFNHEGAMYRRQSTDKRQFVVPRTLIHGVIRESHGPVYMALPGLKRTYDLNFTKLFVAGMRKIIEEYVKRFDP